MSEVNIRKAEERDIAVINQLFIETRAFFAHEGIPQWQSDYPNETDALKDIKNGGGYVAVENNTIIGYSFIHQMIEPTYAYIENGQWLNNDPYIVLHRVCIRSDCKGRGIAGMFVRKAEELAKEKGITNLRGDTHEKNLSMQRMLSKNGFEVCGIVYMEDGSPRLAFQKQM